MQAPGRSTNVAFAAVLLVVLATAGCAGGRGQAAEGTAGVTPTPLAAAVATATPPTAIGSPATTVEPSAQPSPAATAAVGPIPTPDFAAIETLIKDIKDELGADASAGADEGSTP